MNKKGISLMALVLTVILIIIIASISIVGTTKHMDESSKVAFKSDLESFVQAVDLYNELAVMYNRDYDKNLLSWDGESEKATNTAKINDGVNEDTIKTILENNNLPTSLKGIVYIENGSVKVKKDVLPQYEWAVELYSYMK